jgi:hypothetical protein
METKSEEGFQHLLQPVKENNDNHPRVGEKTLVISYIKSSQPIKKMERRPQHLVKLLLSSKPGGQCSRKRRRELCLKTLPMLHWRFHRGPVTGGLKQEKDR